MHHSEATAIKHDYMPVPLRYLNPCFDFVVLNDDIRRLRESFALRYAIYCEELQFLPAENYPSKKETDEFDSYS